MKIRKLSLIAPNFSKDLLRSFEQHGFAVIKGHGVRQLYIHEALDEWHEYFTCTSLEQKIGYLYDKEEQLGYFPFRSEKAKDNDVGDLKEFFHVRRESFRGTRSKLPDSVAHDTRQLFNQLELLGLDLLQILETEYNNKYKTSFNFHDPCIESEQTMMRPIHYPPIKGNVGNAVRSAEHTDINFMTLLVASTAPGLQVKDKKGMWHPVEISPASIVVNIGDMLEMLTKGKLKSTTHRVINPTDNSDKVSIPLFIHPNPDTNLGEMTARQFLNQRLKEIGLK